MQTVDAQREFAARGGRIEKIFYPIPEPGRNAADVVAWLQSREGG